VVDLAQVFFEHSQATAAGIYNLWGQVPVKSEGPVVHYYNLTDMGVTHSGKTGVNYWFRDFIAPTLGDQAPLIEQLQFNGQIDHAQSPSAAARDQSTLMRRASSARAARIFGPAQIVPSDQPEFSGTAAPGSIIRLALSPAEKPMIVTLAGTTTSSSTGQWSLTSRHPLKNGQYRVLVTAFSRKLTTRPAFAIVPTQPLGRLVVDAPSGT
jgi:Bacterial Ig-like domain